MIKKVLTCIAAVAGMYVFGATDSVFSNSRGAAIRYNSKGDVVRGEWTSQLTKAMNLAKNENVPILVFWANNGCGHCAATEVEMCTKTFTNWMKKYQIYMVLAVGGFSGPAGKEADVAKEVARDSSGEFPYIAVYWGTGASNTYKGKAFTNKKRGTFTGNGATAASFIAKAEALLKGYTPAIGGWFDVEEKGEHRYEAEASTKTVALKLARDKSKKAATGTDSVKVYKGSTLLKTYTVNWAKNAATTDLSVSIPSGMKAGEKLKAVINGEKAAKYINYIYFVEKENGAGNPKWVGEKFGFGEWTADIDAAKKMVAGASGKAYTLVSVQGSLWCHDCANTDRNFLDLEADGVNRFQAWAKSKNVALVAVDIPNYQGKTYKDCTSPTLFSKDAYSTTLAFENAAWGIFDVSQAGAPPKLTNATVRSGLAYMSRKGISEADALATVKKFHDLAYKSVDDGGFHVYFGVNDAANEDSNANRTGVPIFVLLRKDGSIAARLTRFASKSPVKADRNNFANFIKRFEEMLTIADAGAGSADVNEISNNYPSAKATALPIGGEALGRLCNADARDTFKLTGFNGAANVLVDVFGEADAEVIVEFLVKKDGAFELVGEPASVNLSAGARLLGEFEDTGDCYLRVRAADITAEAFDVANAAANHFTGFSVSARVEALNPQQSYASVPAEVGDVFAISVTSGQVYRITGIEVPGEGSGLVPLDGIGDMYAAVINGDAEITADDSGEVGYQAWASSEIAFNDDEPKKGIGESVGTWSLKVLRNDGVSGPVEALVELDVDNTTFYYDHDTKELPRFAVDDEWGFTSKKLTWADGDDDEKTLEITLEKNAEIAKYFGDGQIAFKLSVTGSEIGDATVGKATYVLKVKDESDKKESVISLVGSNPAWSYSRTVYARRKDGVAITLQRSNAGNTLGNRILLKSSVSSVVFEGDGDFYDSSQYWDANDYTDRVVKATKLPKAGKKTVVTLKGEKNTFQPDASADSVTIVSVDNDAPAFTKDTLGRFDLVTYSSFKESVNFDGDYIEKGDTLSAELVKGSLPKGIKAKVSGTKLVFSGIPTKAGSFTAYYRACATRGKKKVEGLPVKISFRVVDPATVSKDDKDFGYLANAAVKTSRTLSTLLVTSGGATPRLAGTLDLTIPKSGKLSAKYVCRGGTVTFSSKSWDAKSFNDTDGTLTATLAASKSGYELQVKAYPNKRVEATVVDPTFKDQELSAYSDGKPWTSSSSAKSYAGIYNAALVPGGSPYFKGDGPLGQLSGSITDPVNENFAAPRGYGYVSLKMTTAKAYQAGKVTWAGKLPNGMAVSGSAVLSRGVNNWLGRKGYVYLPLFARLSKGADIVSVAVEIQSGKGLRSVFGSPDLYNALPLGLWQHKGDADTGYEMDLHLMGGYYDPDKSLKDCCLEEAGVPTKQKLRFTVPELVGWERNAGRGEGLAIETLDLKIANRAITVTSDENPARFKLKVDLKTGILSGTMRVYYTAASGAKKYLNADWYGVMLPGWGSGCGCVEGADAIYMPFINGGFFFGDEVPYTGSKTKTEDVLSGGGVYSGADLFPR